MRTDKEVPLMEREKYVIIGGDAAGMSAAGQIRKLQPKAEIVAYERSPHTSYSGRFL